jgi:hypothetical protein
LLGLFFNPDGKGNMFFWNNGGWRTCPKLHCITILFFIFIVMRTPIQFMDISVKVLAVQIKILTLNLFPCDWKRNKFDYLLLFQALMYGMYGINIDLSGHQSVSSFSPLSIHFAYPDYIFLWQFNQRLSRGLPVCRQTYCSAVAPRTFTVPT